MKMSIEHCEHLGPWDAKSFANSYIHHAVELGRVCASIVVIKHSTKFVIPEMAYFFSHNSSEKEERTFPEILIRHNKLT